MPAAATATEATIRRDLAAAYRLAARRGWDDIVWTHISAAVPGEEGVYLINRFGLRFDEIRPDNLVKVDVHGRVVDGTDAPVNPSGFAIHGAVHAARADAVCVLHLHTRWGQTLAALPDGLLPCSQPALRLWKRLGRHAYEGLAFDAAERGRLVAALGTLDGLILANHGTLTVGRTVAEAFVLMHLLERAAQVQIAAMATGRVACVGDEVAERTQQQWIGDGSVPEGGDEWPALLRSLEP
jgi:ribulose-5-phosphate 4-epimerase/fuculose-1-phosphate aldolase